MGIFRKAALSRFSSPQQTDKMPRVERPIGIAFALSVLLVCAAVCIWAFFGTVSLTIDAPAMLVAPDCAVKIASPARAQIKSIYIKEGSPVQKGQVLAELTGDRAVYAPCSGTVGALLAKEGDLLLPGQALARVTPEGEAIAVCFLGDAQVKPVSSGNPVYFAEGFSGNILCADEIPSDSDEIRSLAGAQADALPKTATVAAIKLQGEFPAPNASLYSAKIVYRQCAPIELIFSRAQEDAQ